jgi:tRNA-dihydrouridine synthase B
VLALALRHAQMMADWKGEHCAVIEMRKHFAWYLKGMHGAAALRRELNHMDALERVKQALTSFMLVPSAD